MNKFTFLVLALLISISKLLSADTLSVYEQLPLEEQLRIYQEYVDSIAASFTYEYGEIILENNIATINVPKGFKYLNGTESERVLTELWGNPPSGDDYKSLGMLFEESSSIMSDSAIAINITYSKEGYIKDDDAKELDYDELLETMQNDIQEGNEYRTELGYEPLELVRWASQPYYDELNKKLHWAKELKFGEANINTLNYNIRILGRKGFLELNAISSIDVLARVKENVDPILASVNFNEGHKYADFNPDIDKVAAYGIGGLIAGKLLLKAGILAKLGILLAKFWKIIAVGIIAFGAGIRKFLGSKKDVLKAPSESSGEND